MLMKLGCNNTAHLQLKNFMKNFKKFSTPSKTSQMF